MPKFDLLPEADISDMEAFLEEIQLVLPVVGADFLKRPAIKNRSEKTAKSSNQTTSFDHENLDNLEVTFALLNKTSGIEATAREEAGEFIVLAGSKGSMKERPSFHEKQKLFRDEAFETERARKINDKNFVLEQDISFSSPSAAAVFLFGTSRNGRTDWVVEGKGISYGAWKDEMIEARSLL